jgi:hypothetical protein
MSDDLTREAMKRLRELGWDLRQRAELDDDPVDTDDWRHADDIELLLAELQRLRDEAERREQEAFTEAVDEEWKARADAAATIAALTRLVDEMRRMLWIIADRNIGGLRISDAELEAVDRIPGIEVETDSSGGGLTIRALTATDLKGTS